MRDLPVIDMVEIEPGVFELPRQEPADSRAPRMGPAPSSRSRPRARARQEEHYVPPPRDESLVGEEKLRHEIKRARQVIGALVFDDPGAREELINDLGRLAVKIVFDRLEKK